jgi:hypothetical protein
MDPKEARTLWIKKRTGCTELAGLKKDRTRYPINPLDYKRTGSNEPAGLKRDRIHPKNMKRWLAAFFSV